MATITSKEESLTVRLGSDLKFPIKNNFEPISGLSLLLQDIQQLLLTVPGERVMRPNFGCNLRNQIWENIDDAATQGAASIRSSLATFEPRITVTSVDFTINRNTDLVSFVIRFIVNKTDQRVNLIFPFRSSTELSFN